MAKTATLRAYRRVAERLSEPELDIQQDVGYAVAKTAEEHRYTLGILYVPGALDSDDEWVTSDELQKAVWDYVRKGDRRVRDTHNRDVVIGEQVELISWPYEVEVEAPLPSGEVRKYKLPPGTIFEGVIWGDEAWSLVKAGKLRGFSMGGKAVRLKEASEQELPRMRDFAVAKSDDEVEKNWVEDVGGLPRYIKDIAKALMKTHGEQGAYRLAVGIVKRWCRGEGEVSEKTRAKACKAVTEWEAKKARAHAKSEWEEPTDDEIIAATAEIDEATWVTLLADE